MSEIEKFKEQIDFVALVEEYTKVKRTGKNYMALCPFHEEKTPSFSIDPENKLFHCFGCGKSGDLISFVMEIEGLSFPEAIEFLSKKYNIPSPRVSKKTSRIETEIFSLNELIMKHYMKNLFSREGKTALNYLKNRGIREDTIREFKLGFSKKDDRELIKEVSKFPKAVIENSGVFYFDKGQLKDRFSERLIIPIFNLSGRVVAFGGRALNGEEPKYKNSPETLIYKKRNLLYGVNFSRAHIRREDEAILVEGYFDLISLYQEGIKNVVGSLGTSLTREQVFLIKKFTDNVLFFYDFDSAGLNSMKRTFPLFIEAGVFVKVFKGEKGLDPDEFIRKYHKDGFVERKKESMDIIKLFYLDLKDQHEKKSITENLINTLRNSDDSLFIEETILSIHSYTGYPIEVLKGLLKQKKITNKKENQKREKIKLQFFQSIILKFLLKNDYEELEVYIPLLREHENFLKKRFPEFYRLINFILNNKDSEDFWEITKISFSDDVSELFVQMISNDDVPSSEEDFKMAVSKLKEIELKEKLSEINNLIETRDNDEIEELFEEKLKIISELKQLHQKKEDVNV